MDFTQIVIAILGTLTAVIGGYYTWKLGKDKTKAEEDKAESDAEQEFIATLLSRVDKLETRVDTISIDMFETARKADEERRKLIQEYEKRVESVRLEMRKLVDEGALETATWRDRYYEILKQFSDLRVEYTQLKIDNQNIRSELDKLQSTYDQLREMHFSRRYPDLDQTA